jgi:hypothetical protein
MEGKLDKEGRKEGKEGKLGKEESYVRNQGSNGYRSETAIRFHADTCE